MREMASTTPAMARRIAIELFLMLAVGLLLGLIGPFGTFEIPVALRICIWMLLILSGYPIFRSLGTVARWLSAQTAVPWPVALAIALAIGAIPMALIVAALFMRMDPLTALQSPQFLMLYGEVWLLGLVIHGAMQMLLNRDTDAPSSTALSGPSPAAGPVPAQEAAAQSARSPEPAPEPEPAPAPENPLALPPGFGPLLALRGEDHYVRAIADGRDHLLLMRLRDAIAALPPADGVQVHRSWWVAQSAIQSLTRDGRSATLTLTNGHAVPVARDKVSHIAALLKAQAHT